MKCPNCGVVYADQCSFCGASLVPEKKGSHWVPILILVGLTLLGLFVFFATGGQADLPLPPVQDGGNDPFLIRDGRVFAAPEALLFTGEVTVPDTVNGEKVTGIGGYGFAGHSSMTAIHLPDTLDSIGEGAFVNCFELRALDIPESVTVIGYSVFNGCGSLEAVHIPASVSFIGSDAFDGCDHLAFIFYDGTMAQWEDIAPMHLPDGVQVICSDGTAP